jgi:cholesterol oxidase
VKPSYDAIVVGSGFGGGIAACRLAEAGKSVCVLERGRRFSGGDFVERPEQAGRLIWHPAANPDGMFDVRLMRDIVVITAAGVGGGSLVYANVQLRAPADVFEHPRWPAAITATSLEPWYVQTEAALDPKPTPAAPPLRKVEAFGAAGAQIGRPVKPLPLAVHFGEKRNHPFSGVPQQGCDNLARCDIGCPINAKNTVDITYLARAEAKGAELLPLHLAKRIDPPARAGGPWRVGFQQLSGGSGSVEAPILILSAGTLGTPRLLFGNQRRLPNLSPALGTCFSGNGDALGVAFDPQVEAVKDARNDVGPVMTGALDFTDDRHLILADGGLPPGFGGVLDIARGANLIRRWSRLLVRVRYLLALAGWSDQALRPRELKSLERDARRWQAPNRDALIFLMFGHDAADGRMRLTPLLRRFDIRWSKAGSAKLFADLERTANELAKEVDATPFYALDGGPLGKFMTVHPLGGCPMSDDASSGVVDHLGAVWGHRGLFVLDGSIVPTALGVNPSKTIAALAERGVAGLLSR